MLKFKVQSLYIIVPNVIENCLYIIVPNAIENCSKSQATYLTRTMINRWWSLR